MIKTLGDHVILKTLGEGTFGDVYLTQHRFTKKKYVIKILSQNLSKDKEFVKKFEEDIQALVLLDHPSIVKLHNISFQDGRYFLVMDGIIDDKDEVTSLEKYLQDNATLSEKNLETILRQIASALDYVHSKKTDHGPIIHRGLKLSNIFIKEKNDKLHVFISDVGLSRLIGEKRVLLKTYESMLKNMHHTDNRFFKNLSFLSPEQKKQEPLTPASDVYSFGVLAYYLITKRLPQGYFPLPSKTLDYSLNWDSLICNCLKLSPEDRPEGLIEAMNKYLSKDVQDATSIDVLSWEEVEKKVENAMQMSFEFSEETTDDAPPKPIIKPQKIEKPSYEQDPGAIFKQELAISYYKPKKEEIKDVKPILTKMVIIKGGTYKRGGNNGARDEMPTHSVTISSFAMDIHPVTNEQFLLFLEMMGGEKDGNNNYIIRLRDSKIKKNKGKLAIESGYLKHPVVGVTWYGANAYAKWVGKRLPYEVEWEIACKGEEEARYPYGEKIDHTMANFFSSDTTSVMSYPPNGYGIYDMVGNVYEWCFDWYAYNYYDTSSQEPENPKGPDQGVYRVLRGGCWKSLKEDLRSAHRHRNNPGAFNSTYGFRCAADVS